MKDHHAMNVNEEILETTAKRLLKNPAINQRLLPDKIEKKLYMNCLKLVCYVLDAISSSFRITVCGHDLTIRLEPTTKLIEKAASKVASSLSPVDLDALKDFARQVGLDDEDDDDDPGLLERAQRGMLVKLHTTLFALILGVIDDLLANTQLDILSDRIQLDIVPQLNQHKAAVVATKEPSVDPTITSTALEVPNAATATATTTTQMPKRGAKGVMAASFLVGTALGSSVMAFLAHGDSDST
jgi:hypothetical protein